MARARNRSTQQTLLILAPCYDEPKRTTGSVPKISEELSRLCRVVVFCGGSSTRIENRSPTLRIYFNKEFLIPDPANVAFVPGMHKALDRVLQKENPTALLNIKHMFPINTLVHSLARRGYRVVTATDTFPGYNWFTASALGNIALWVYARLWPLRVLRRSERVILFHRRLLPVAKKLKLPARVIPNGVDVRALQGAPTKKLAGKVNVVYAGRLESVKGYETMFAAMARVIAKYPQVHFYHVGDASGKEEFLQRYRHPNIHIVGRLPLQQVYGYLKGSDIVLLASKSEGLPNALLEGMAAGCVPVATPVGAIPEVLRGGELGKLVSYGDVNGFVRAIEKLVENPLQRKWLSKRCVERISRSYNWETLAQEYYEELFTSKKPSAKVQKS